MATKQTRARGMNKPLLILVVAIVALGVTSFVQAMLLDGPDVIAAPAIIADDSPGATNERQQAFNERQMITLSEDVRCDNVILAAGEMVNSHMIFFNTRSTGISSDLNRTWTFADDIICVMSNNNGLYQALTDNSLGAPGTSYPGPFDGRGLEGDDSYSVNGNEITVSMHAEEPGDWIRVLTKVTIPEDETAPVVYCQPGIKPGGRAQDPTDEKKDNDKFLELVGADETDGTVDLYLTDVESGTVFGPYEPGTMISHTIAKGAAPGVSEPNNKLDYAVKSQGALEISATDEAGNEARVLCSE